MEGVDICEEDDLVHHKSSPSLRLCFGGSRVED